MCAAARLIQTTRVISHIKVTVTGWLMRRVYMGFCCGAPEPLWYSDVSYFSNYRGEFKYLSLSVTDMMKYWTNCFIYCFLHSLIWHSIKMIRIIFVEELPFLLSKQTSNQEWVGIQVRDHLTSSSGSSEWPASSILPFTVSGLKNIRATQNKSHSAICIPLQYYRKISNFIHLFNKTSHC